MKIQKLETFMAMAEQIAQLSPDFQRKVGAMAVHPDTYDCILPSYNGFVAGADDSTLPTVRPAKYEYILHAEQNLICQAAKRGRALDGYWSIQTLSPCKHCMRLLFQSGIRTVVFKEEYRDFAQQIRMKDLHLQLTPIGNYVKIEMSPA